MTYAFSPLSRHIPATFLFVCLTACAGSRSQETEAPAQVPLAAAAPAEESSVSDSAASGASERAETKEAEGEAEKEPAPEDDAPFEESDRSFESGGPPPTAPAAAEFEPDKKSRTPTRDLDRKVLDFNQILNAEALSCDGAKPQRDAICSIAARICEMEGPGATKGADCSRAQESCQKAKTQYREKCG